MSRYLIINADDFGMCRGSNLAVMDLLKDKNSALTSSTIMAPCAWAPEAAAFAKANPQFAIGVHWTFTSEWNNYRWAPVNKTGTDSLRDEDGFMFHESKDFELHSKSDEVKAEAVAQICRLAKLGLSPSHIDNHMGSIYGIETGRFELLQIAFDIASEYNLPFRFPGNIPDEMFSNAMLDIKIDKSTAMNVFSQIIEYAGLKRVIIPDYLIPNDWNGSQSDSYENFKEYIYNLYKSFPDGAITETYMHPSIETQDLKGATGCWQRRVWEYQLLKDPQTKQHIESLGIKLINYRDLAEIKGQS